MYCDIDTDCLKDIIVDVGKDRTVYRPQGSYTDKGRWQHANPEPLSIRMILQPATAKDMKQLPEGRRTEEAIKVHSYEELFCVSVKNQKQPDRIEWLGDMYEVHSVENWSEQGYYMSIAVKVGQ